MCHLNATAQKGTLPSRWNVLTSCRLFLFHVSAFLLEFMFWKAKGDWNIWDWILLVTQHTLLPPNFCTKNLLYDIRKGSQGPDSQPTLHSAVLVRGHTPQVPTAGPYSQGLPPQWSRSSLQRHTLIHLSLKISPASRDELVNLPQPCLAQLTCRSLRGAGKGRWEHSAASAGSGSQEQSKGCDLFHWHGGLQRAHLSTP